MPAFAQFDFYEKPIEYERSEFTDRVAQLKSAIDEGAVRLKWDRQHGWLPALLDYLSVPESSQTLVFSKTSVQRKVISPERPRALYFKDDVYVGWVQHGEIVELSAVDPEQGAVFYSVEQKEQGGPVIQRDKGQCMSCHATRQTHDVPGYLVRSVFPDASGEPRLDLGSEFTDPTTPFEKRYGGWYVTAKQGTADHRGNRLVEQDQLEPLKDAIPATLDGMIDARPYLEPGSDLVALMVLEHQALVHNLITKASYDTRNAVYYDSVVNRALDRPEDYRSDSTQRRIDAAAGALVRALLFCDEAPLAAPIVGSSRFAEEFAQQGPRDSQGRSLREFDLQTRLFRYPCSYLIDSDGFDSLPEPVLQAVQALLSQALADEPTEGFEHLSLADRRAIREILRATKPGLLADRR
jgi:hypothetical protein